MIYLACDLAREKPFVPPLLIDANTTCSHDLSLGERITGRQFDRHFILLTFVDLITYSDIFGVIIDFDFELFFVKFGLFCNCRFDCRQFVEDDLLGEGLRNITEVRLERRVITSVLALEAIDLGARTTHY